MRWDLFLCTLHPGGTDDQTWAWESGAVALWPCAVGALTFYPHHPILLPHPSLPSSLVIRVVWKTFFSAGGGNSEIRWAVGRLLGLLQGTGSSQTPLILLYIRDEGCRVCFRMCLCVYVYVFAWACNPGCMWHFSHATLSQLVKKTKKQPSLKFSWSKYALPNTHYTYHQPQTVCHILENVMVAQHGGTQYLLKVNQNTSQDNPAQRKPPRPWLSLVLSLSGKITQIY